jgi:hypothetical protein
VFCSDSSECQTNEVMHSRLLCADGWFADTGFDGTPEMRAAIDGPEVGLGCGIGLLHTDTVYMFEVRTWPFFVRL